MKRLSIHALILCSVIIALLTNMSCSSNNNSSDDVVGESCTKTCDTGFVLNSELCECEQEPCTLVCDTGFVLDNDLCQCEEEPCMLTCDTGFELNTEMCECEEFVQVVINVDASSATLVGDWKKKTTIADYTGGGYIVWEGPPQFWKGEANIGTVGKLTYKINVTTPGIYLFNWNSYIAKKAASNAATEHNDSWLRMPDADDFYAFRNNNMSTIYPKGSGKTPNPKGENGNGFFKVYMNTVDAWTNTSSTSDNEAHQIYVQFNEAKEYTVEIAPRSDFHAIDAFKFTLQKP